MSSTENVIIGGGVIGLSLAYELAKRGRPVVLLERDEIGRQSSWAGAGIFPPANAATAIHPLEHMEALSHQLHAAWADELQSLTGLDNGYRAAGGLYLARTRGEAAALAGITAEWAARQIDFQWLDQSSVTQRFPEYAHAVSFADNHKLVFAPGESQFSNPLHLKALTAACRQLGVTIIDQVGSVAFEVARGQLKSVQAGSRQFAAQHYFVTAGPWTEAIVQPLGIKLPMQPVRGQIVLFKLDPARYRSVANGPILNEGTRYLVTRADGHVLAGASIEEAGFDCQTTAAETGELRQWAQTVLPALDDATFVRAWAGLRPGTYDGFPYLGRLSGSSGPGGSEFGGSDHPRSSGAASQPVAAGDLARVIVATGHFKSGLHLSTATAVLLADLAAGLQPTIDLSPFSPLRVLEAGKSKA